MITGLMLADGWTVDLSSTAGPVVPLPFRRLLHAPDLDAGDLDRNAKVSFAGSGTTPRALAFTNLEMLVTDELTRIDLAVWLPFNFNPPPPKLVEFLRRNSPIRMLALTRWAQGALARFDIESEYMPCVVDTSVFKPDPEDRLRKRLDLGVPPDAFVVGVIAVNNEWFGNRKSLPEILLAFRELARRRNDAFLLLHTDTSGEHHDGLHLDDVIASLQVPAHRIRRTDPELLTSGMDRDGIASLFRAMDVLAAPSAGEGFGIPVVEAQACGVPVIVSDWATQRELVGAGWAVDGQPRWADWVRSWQFTPHVHEIVAAMEEAYCSPPDAAVAVRFAAEFDVSSVYRDRWRPFLREWLRSDGGNPAG